ncbi:MAG: hypothetical protein O3B43_03845 [Chloroflexi bacterium]|nr:hypothetical protein [Chloroflexota bacterium]
MLRKIRPAFCLALLAVLVLGACGSIPSDLIVINESSADICGVYLTGADGADEGGNQLGSDKITTGETQTIAGIEPAVYDARFVPCDTSSFEETTYQNLDLTTDIEYTLFDL